MPIIRSAKKRAKQNIVRQVRNNRFRRRLHDVQKSFFDSIKAGNVAEAEKLLPMVYKVVDTCAKRNLLHKNKAGHLKSKAQKTLTAAKA